VEVSEKKDALSDTIEPDDTDNIGDEGKKLEAVDTSPLDRGETEGIPSS
jgi:hypothetical protein